LTGQKMSLGYKYINVCLQKLVASEVTPPNKITTFLSPLAEFGEQCIDFLMGSSRLSNAPLRLGLASFSISALFSRDPRELKR